LKQDVLSAFSSNLIIVIDSCIRNKKKVLSPHLVAVKLAMIELLCIIKQAHASGIILLESFDFSVTFLILDYLSFIRC